MCYHTTFTPLLELYASTVPTRPRNIVFTRVFQDGVELNWIPPKEPNGELHYIIQYGSNTTNTTSNLTYYNLTGLVNGTTYNITVMAVNSAGSNTSDVMEYTHKPRIHNTIAPTPTTTSTNGMYVCLCMSSIDKILYVRISNYFQINHYTYMFNISVMP